MSALDRFFDLKGRGTTAATELRGAAATFLTMAYILVANAGFWRRRAFPASPSSPARPWRPGSAAS